MLGKTDSVSQRQWLGIKIAFAFVLIGREVASGGERWR